MPGNLGAASPESRLALFVTLVGWLAARLFDFAFPFCASQFAGVSNITSLHGSRNGWDYSSSGDSAKSANHFESSEKWAGAG
jgi:hypothetical protein